MALNRLFVYAVARALAVLVLLVAQGCQEHSPTRPSAQGLVILNGYPERPYFHDFGNLPFGQQAQHVFEIENTDPVPVAIQDMKASCGCVTPRVSYTAADGRVVEGALAGDGPVITLPPGALARITVKVDTTHVQRMNTDKLEQVRLRSDSLATPYITLEMHLVVERLFRSVPERIDLGLVPQSTGKSARADLSTEIRGSAARILGVESVEGPLVVHVDATEMAGETLWILSLDVKPEQALGTLVGKVKLQTTGADGTGAGLSLEVPVIGQVVPDVVLDPGLLVFRTGEAGSAPRAEAVLVALVPGERVLIRSTALSGAAADQLRVEATPIEPDENGRATRWKVAVEVSETARDQAFSGTLTIETDHPRVPTVRAPYTRAP